MKVRFTLLVAFLCLCLTNVKSQRTCSAMDHLHHEIETNPERAKTLEAIERHTQKFLREHTGGRMALVTIPVVVHVVYNGSAENISTAQINSQIQILNDDFRRLNSDADNVWSQAADSEIEFCLASVDPNGNATDGITRTSTSVSSFGTNDQVKFASSGGKDAWPASDYLNMWVCDISGSILGYAQFPGGNPATDGVVMDYQYFGDIGTATAPFDLGRTATHEVGHWLNLRHIWGDGNCNADDFVSDTPSSDAPNYGCALGHVSCSSTDMVQNYMDYSDDACMNLFTQGQKSRMQALFSPGGAKASLLTSNGCGNGNPPPPPPSCNDNEVTVSITLDNYPEETSWSISNDAGSTVASGGTYGSQADGSTVTVDLCLVDGCYTFTINDVYGDGICCSYGNGSYSVTNAGTSLASGGSFGSSESTPFCLGGSPPPPPATCTDGIQNGSETGVDCGGPDCSPCNTGGPVVLLEGYFESGLDGWVDGGGDCYRYRGSRSYEGDYSIRIRDNSGTASSMTSPSLDLAGFNTVDVEFYFYAFSMENGEDFWLRYNDGSGWQTVATYASGTNFNNNTFYTATVTLDASSYNLTNGGEFRFQCDASANADQIYIDQVTITGNNNSRQGGESLSELNSNLEAAQQESDLVITPNPTRDMFTYSLSTNDEVVSVKIFDLSGRVVMSRNNTRDNNLNIGHLENGVYILSIETTEEVISERIMKF